MLPLCCREPSPAAPAIGMLPVHTWWGWSSVSTGAGSLQGTHWHGSGCWQGAECCVRELLARLRECLMFKRSET